MLGGILLLLLVALASLGPELVARLSGGTVAAWDYVLNGVQSAALWVLIAGLSSHWLARASAALGTFEAMQRPMCRALFPMDRPPRTGGIPLWEAAFGAPVSWLGLIAALFVALLAQEAHRAEQKH